MCEMVESREFPGEERFVGPPYGGLDLSTTDDTTGFVAMCPVEDAGDEPRYEVVDVWSMPRRTMAEREESEKKILGLTYRC